MAHPAFPLPTGYVLPEGTIVDVTETSYKVEPTSRCSVCGTPSNGDCPALSHGLRSGYEFVPFTRVHPPTPVVGLVSFADGSRYGR